MTRGLVSTDYLIILTKRLFPRETVSKRDHLQESPSPREFKSQSQHETTWLIWSGQSGSVYTCTENHPLATTHTPTHLGTSIITLGMVQRLTESTHQERNELPQCLHQILHYSLNVSTSHAPNKREPNGSVPTTCSMTLPKVLTLEYKRKGKHVGKGSTISSNLISSGLIFLQYIR